MKSKKCKVCGLDKKRIKIERLKNNWECWGRLSEEDKKIFQSGEVPVELLLIDKHDEQWELLSNSQKECIGVWFSCIYRISPSYTPPPGENCA